MRSLIHGMSGQVGSAGELQQDTQAIRPGRGDHSSTPYQIDKGRGGDQALRPVAAGGFEAAPGLMRIFWAAPAPFARFAATSRGKLPACRCALLARTKHYRGPYAAIVPSARRKLLLPLFGGGTEGAEPRVRPNAYPDHSGNCRGRGDHREEKEVMAGPCEHPGRTGSTCSLSETTLLIVFSAYSVHSAQDVPGWVLVPLAASDRLGSAFMSTGPFDTAVSTAAAAISVRTVKNVKLCLFYSR